MGYAKLCAIGIKKISIALHGGLPFQLIRALKELWENDCSTIFPRTDPAVIIAVTFENQICSADSRIGQKACYLFSLVVEPGETPEHADSWGFEEAGVLTKNIVYPIFTALAIPSFPNAGIYRQAESVN